MPCPICGRDDCSQHRDAKIVSLSLDLMVRLQKKTYESLIWARYQVEPEFFGLLPLTFYIAPQDADLASTFWIKEVRMVDGTPRNVSVHLVALETNSSTQLYLHEANTAFVSSPRAMVARGRSKKGYFLLSTNAAAPATASSTVIGAWRLDIQALENIEWEDGKFPGVVRQGAIRAEGYKVPGPTLMIYDHRREAAGEAVVAVTEKSSPNGQRWYHLNLYPVDEYAADLPVCEGRLAIGDWSLAPNPNEQPAWVFQSTTHAGHARVQATVIVAVFLSQAVQAGLELDQLRTKVAEAEEQENPAVLCNALEDLVLALVTQGEIEVGEEHERQWGRYLALRARAERTRFENEAQVAWAKAVQVLRRLVATTEEDNHE